MQITRRDLLRKSAVALGLSGAWVGSGFAVLAETGSRSASTSTLPPHLAGYEALYARDPLQAAKQWFKEARLGFGLHWSLGSIVGEGMVEEKLTSHEYNALRSAFTEQDWEKVRDKFTAQNFDPRLVTDLALEMGARYLNFTTKHAGGLFLWNTAVTDFNSVKSPARRDFVRELAEECHKKKLGLCLYHGGDILRQRPEDLFREERGILYELLNNYGPIANIWFDGIVSYYANPQAYTGIPEIYQRIHETQPHCLISFKQGTGREDFVICEGQWGPMNPNRHGEIAELSWTRNLHRGCWGEIHERMQVAPRHYFNIDGCEIMSVQQILICLSHANANNASLLINIGPRFDGSLPGNQVRTLRELGAHIRGQEFPEPRLRDKEVWRSWHGRRGDKVGSDSPHIRKLLEKQRALIQEST